MEKIKTFLTFLQVLRPDFTAMPVHIPNFTYAMRLLSVTYFSFFQGHLNACFYEKVWNIV